MVLWQRSPSLSGAAEGAEQGASAPGDGSFSCNARQVLRTENQERGLLPAPSRGDLAGLQILEYGFCWGCCGWCCLARVLRARFCTSGEVGPAPGDGGHVAAVRAQEGTVPAR